MQLIMAEEVGQGGQDEGALMPAGVWDFQRGAAEGLAMVEDDVEVDWAGAPSLGLQLAT